MSGNQPYGVPSNYSSEEQKQFKASRRTAPVSVLKNEEGVADFYATPGQLHIGGALVENRPVHIFTDGNKSKTLTAAELVGGLFIHYGGNDTTLTLTLPNAADLARYVNSQLCPKPGTLGAADASTYTAVFKVTLVGGSLVTFVCNATAVGAPAYTSTSGYSIALQAETTGAGSYTALAAGAGPVKAKTAANAVVDVYFICESAAGQPAHFQIVSAATTA